ncbi:MAG: hypothetical protein KIT36_00280 [Alphaproteobacteria bacterium]|nr:hypothetical protein [Alphaproteobacteria bacterium]
MPLAFGLSACSQPVQEEPPLPIVEAPKSPPRPAPPKPAPTAQASRAETRFTTSDTTNGNLPSTATVKPPEPQEMTEPTPQQVPSLAGLTEQEVTRRFGPPTSVRKTPAASIWTYRDESCTLELFLFTDMRSGGQKVLTYQLSGSGRDILGDRGCLERLGSHGKAG